MRALSIKSPWWEKILSGEKRIETRTWKTKFRGEFLICATKPVGMAVGIASIIDCRLMLPDEWEDACCNPYPGAYGFHLRDVRAIKPFPVKGKLSFYNVEVPLEKIYSAVDSDK